MLCERGCERARAGRRAGATFVTQWCLNNFGIVLTRIRFSSFALLIATQIPLEKGKMHKHKQKAPEPKQIVGFNDSNGNDCYRLRHKLPAID